MKKKFVTALLITAMATSVFTGCGNRMEGDGRVQAAMAEDGSGPESDTLESEPEATAEPTKEPSSEHTAVPESSTAPEASENNEDGETGNNAIEAGLGAASAYTFTKMDGVVMYAKSGVNVRDLPGTDGKQISKLSAGEEVTVTGKCVETGWYRIVINNSDAYVSDSYLVSEKPSTQSASQNSSQSGSSAQGTGGQSASNQGTSQGQGQGQQTQATSTSNEVSTAFIDYLNQQRAAAGLSQVSWDSGLAEAAKTRAVEISTNFDHDLRYNAAENILGNPSSSVSAWYEQWYNSEGHRLTMMDPNLTSAAAAFYEVDGYYWVVFLAYRQVPVQSAEEWNETKENSDEWTQVQTEENDGFNTYVSDGVEVSDDAEGDAAADELLRQMGLL